LITNAIAKRYAKALVQLASEEGSLEASQQELAGFERIVSGTPELRAALASPACSMESKQRILNDLLAKIAPSVTVGNFLRLLLERNRLVLLPQIVVCYGVLADRLAGVVRPVLTTALPLEESEIGEIRGSLERTTGKKVVLDVVTDQSLIGGVITQIGDRVYDGSVRTQLSRIHDILQKG
jgi:F-type H+-transporting ATPase subunit delta